MISLAVLATCYFPDVQYYYYYLFELSKHHACIMPKPPQCSARAKTLVQLYTKLQ